MEKTTQGRISKGQFFAGCLKASISKSYEFCLEAYANRKNQVAFFLAPTLRSICEDLIVLAYIAKLPRQEREEVTGLLMQLEIATRIEIQTDFFRAARPDQPVLSAEGVDTVSIKNEIRRIWQNNGWPRFTKGHMPNIRQIAEKHHFDLLTTLYDYLYRLTSGMVHFNPQVLLRSGWGKPPSFHFSPRHFNDYYFAFARTYGLLLFCLYFELFARFLRPGPEIRKSVSALRKDLLLQPRWPEMVTYEEMNLSPPTGEEVLRFVLRFIDAEQRQEKLLAPRNQQ